MISDHKLRQDVLEELDFEPSLDVSHIAVGVHDAVVTLSGSVPSYADKLAAERAAKHVFGVRAIAQNLEIRLPSDKKTADDEIAKRAADILRWCVGVPIGSRSRSRKAS
jgi:hypothetical protein